VTLISNIYVPPCSNWHNLKLSCKMYTKASFPVYVLTVCVKFSYQESGLLCHVPMIQLLTGQKSHFTGGVGWRTGRCRLGTASLWAPFNSLTNVTKIHRRRNRMSRTVTASWRLSAWLPKDIFATVSTRLQKIWRLMFVRVSLLRELRSVSSNTKSIWHDFGLNRAIAMRRQLGDVMYGN
jgi:hypothetical protein